MTTDVDVVVLGLGPGGETVAAKLAKAGLSVVGIEARLVGGECPYYGCVPSKMMIAAAGTLAQARHVPQLAGAAQVQPDWAPVATRIREEATDDWDDTVAVERLESSGATFVRGTGTITGPGQVEVNGTTYAASRAVVVNTGTEPAIPPIDGLADTPYWTNRDVVQLTELPASLVVIGAGAIGAELAQVMARFGVQVTLLEVADRVLPPEEPEAGAMLQDAFVAEGMKVRTGVSISRVDHADGTFTVSLGDEQITADKLLVSAGRRSNLAGIGLEHMGADPEASTLETDERMRAGDRLWGIGDITGKGAFTHVSMYQADVAVRDILGEDGPWADYRAVARVTFTGPEVASVGLTEAQAREQGLDVRVASGDLGARGWLAKEEGLIKVVASDGVLVGATVVGSAGGEIMGMLATAIHARVPVETLLGMHYAYPTYHRAVESVLHDLD
ncbi:dihydrolipoyl dehydrogenase family protein [Nocardioides donggukensis]|uniref:NAD(P)/FAD-dependent oxidoreductase n=1 Tax=Nocardioides donggukensis TaxID=2774019 RepID=A0A927Q169_9ACTN|nr:NAD(P)/FAD-dependent oxidoreductase [Nocardioides donggukensis]MBD8869747.1 NAD(P)/FAD-dependent oxidoreductase [Nocardioides donggukensis]